MKDRMERLVVLPFVVGCVSSSSVAICAQQKRIPAKHALSTLRIKKVEENRMSSENMMRSSYRFLSTLPKPNISIGLQKLSKTLKNFSQFFVFKVEMQEAEPEMEIGFPTDVKHVTHIGLDGSKTTLIPSGGGDNKGDCRGNSLSNFLSFSPTTLSQFELAMPTQTNNSPSYPFV